MPCCGCVVISGRLLMIAMCDEFYRWRREYRSTSIFDEGGVAFALKYRKIVAFRYWLDAKILEVRAMKGHPVDFRYKFSCLLGTASQEKTCSSCTTGDLTVDRQLSEVDHCSLAGDDAFGSITPIIARFAAGLFLSICRLLRSADRDSTNRGKRFIHLEERPRGC